MYRHLPLACLLLLLASCANGTRTRGMDIPIIAVESPDSIGFGGSDVARATFRLHRIVASIKRGEVIVHFPSRRWKKWRKNDLCNIGYGKNATLEWGAGPREFGDWRTEFGKVFYDSMKSRGASVVGDPTKTFGAVDSAGAAEFLIGARIVEIKGNLCNKHDYWDARPLRETLGEMYLKIEWEVFSSLTRQVVHKFSTEGYARTRQGKRQGYLLTFTNAFADAVERAARNKGFKKVLLRNPDAPVVSSSSFGTLSLVGSRLFRGSIKKHLGEIRTAVVTIERANAHGSGFLITKDGYLLTNAHVVRDGKRISVLFSNGVRVAGNVVRVDKARDVALIKIPILVANALPILQNSLPQTLDTVFALGTPLRRALRSTVTKGIVSAHRKLDGNPYIQADVAISGGNSGGPLLDKMGNVVGISVSGYDGQNLNLFIPIDDALSALQMKIAVK